MRAGIFAVCIAAFAVASSAPALAPQPLPPGTGSVIRPGALDDIPRHLTEIGWDTDLPSLLGIRYQPEKMNSDSSWSSWVTSEMLKHTGFMPRPRSDPWPPIFARSSSFVGMPGGQLSLADMQVFQAWCLRRSQVIPPIIVHSAPFVAPLVAGKDIVILPLGVRRGQPQANQMAIGVGFAETWGLALARNADDYAVIVPPEVIASLPPTGLTLETRLRWSDPVPADNPMSTVTFKVPGEPVSVRLVADRRVLWEHNYGASEGSASTGPTQTEAPGARPAKGRADIKF